LGTRNRRPEVDGYHETAALQRHEVLLGGVGEVHAFADGGEGAGTFGDDHWGFDADEIEFDLGAGDADVGDVVEVDVGGFALVGGKHVKAHGGMMRGGADFDNCV